jgi:hypothetical protein
MTRKRKLLVGLLVLSAGVGGWFYYYMFMSPDAAIRHAEAFLFRRMKVAQLGEQGVFRFFFATNRKVDSDEGPLEESFGKERESVLKFGSFDTEIRSSLGLGMLINPTEWFLDEEIRLRGVDALERESFVEQMLGHGTAPAGIADAS